MRMLNVLIGGAWVLVASTLFGADDAALDQAKVGELNEAYVTAFNSQDAKKIASLFTVNSDFTLLTGDWLSGRVQVAGGHAAFFKNNPEAKISGKQLSARLIQSDVLLATGKWNVKNGPPEFSSSGFWATVVVKNDGKWQYEAMRLMVPATPSSSDAAQ